MLIRSRSMPPGRGGGRRALRDLARRHAEGEATKLNMAQVVKLLDATLAEEKKTDDTLSKIAETAVNYMEAARSRPEPAIRQLNRTPQPQSRLRRSYLGGCRPGLLSQSFRWAAVSASRALRKSSRCTGPGGRVAASARAWAADSSSRSLVEVAFLRRLRFADVVEFGLSIG
jgi:hypothetical protein